MIFFIEALRQRSAAMAVVAFAALVCDLLTRMGSMFTIPFLMMWIPLSLAEGRAARIRILAALAGLFLVISGHNILIAHAYSDPGSRVGGNFSYTACALAHGGDCIGMFGSEIREGRIPDLDQFFYSEAIRAFAADPTVSIRAVLFNMVSYVSTLPDFLLFQYKPIAHIHDRFVYPFLLLLIPGWLYTLKLERRSLTLSFGLVILVSTVLSAAVVFDSDGTRVMHVTHPLVATMFATGFAAPVSLRRPDGWPILSWRLGAGTIITVMLAFLFAPPLISHVIRKATDFDPTLERNRKDLLIVPGGRFYDGISRIAGRGRSPARRAGAPCLDLRPDDSQHPQECRSILPLRSRASLVVRALASSSICTRL